jgi:hypothetical protein
MFRAEHSYIGRRRLVTALPRRLPPFPIGCRALALTRPDRHHPLLTVFSRLHFFLLVLREWASVPARINPD